MFFDDIDDLFFPQRRQFSTPKQRFEAPYYYYPPQATKQRYRNEPLPNNYRGSTNYDNEYDDDEEDYVRPYAPGYPYPMPQRFAMSPQQRSRNPNVAVSVPKSRGQPTRGSPFYQANLPQHAQRPVDDSDEGDDFENDDDNVSEESLNEGNNPQKFRKLQHDANANQKVRQTPQHTQMQQQRQHQPLRQQQQQQQQQPQQQTQLQLQHQVKDLEKNVTRIQAHIRRWLIQTRGLLDKLRAVEHVNQSLHSVIQKYKTTLDLISQFDSERLENLKAAAKNPTFELTSIPNKKERQKVIAYEDELMRLLISLDNISVGGIELLREKRKQVVKTIQQLLDTIEKHKSICQKLEEIETIVNTTHRTPPQNTSINETTESTERKETVDKSKEQTKDERKEPENIVANVNESQGSAPMPITTPRTNSSNSSPVVTNRVPSLYELCRNLINNALRVYAANSKRS
jgi:hypothetical protein